MVSQQSATISLPQAPKTCKGCGQCCIGLGVDVYSSDDVPDHMLYIEDDQSPIMRQRKDSSCIALDRKTMTCTIYDRRPEVCRQFEHGGLILTNGGTIKPLTRKNIDRLCERINT